MSSLFKLRGKNGEQPIPCASSVDIYTNFTKIVFPMRWDNEEITEEQIVTMTERFCECHSVTSQAYDIMKEVLTIFDGDDAIKTDLTWLFECFDMGMRLTGLLYEYMLIYGELHSGLGKTDFCADEQTTRIEALRIKIADYLAWVDASDRKPIDKFGGSLVRRRDIGEHLEYWTSIMLSSIRTGKRIPDDVRPLPKKDWW